MCVCMCVWCVWGGRYPGEGNGNPLQYSCLENSMNSKTTVDGVTSQTPLNDYTHTHTHTHTHIYICINIRFPLNSKWIV